MVGLGHVTPDYTMIWAKPSKHAAIACHSNYTKHLR